MIKMFKKNIVTYDINKFFKYNINGYKNLIYNTKIQNWYKYNIYRSEADLYLIVLD